MGGGVSPDTTRVAIMPDTGEVTKRPYTHYVLTYLPPECVVNLLSPDLEWVFCTVYASNRGMSLGHWGQRLESREWTCILCGEDAENVLGYTEPVMGWSDTLLKYGLVVSNTVWLIDPLNPERRDRIYEGERLLDARWAPDGSAIAAVTPDGQLLLIAPDGSGHRVLAEDPEKFSPNEDLAWSPNARHIYFTKRAAHSWGREVWVVDVRSGESRQIFERDSASLMLLGMSRYGYLLMGESVYREGEEEIRLWVWEGSRVVNSVSVKGYSYILGNSVWSPDGRRAALLIASRDGTERLMEVNITEGSVQAVPLSEQMDISDVLAWTPEGIIVSTYDGIIGLLQIPTE